MTADRATADRKLRCRHENVHEGELHPCPFLAEVWNDPRPRCDCCDACSQDCADDI